MRLYMFEHCSLCFRVRMTAALKRVHLQETVVLDDDSDTMIDLVGKRVIPILVKDDGTSMLESLDMVASYEAWCRHIGIERFLLDLRASQHDDLRRVMSKPRLERYIGVIYRPETERWSHYSYATLPDQYDAFAWFDETHAVTPLSTTITAGEDETYPFGL